MYLDGGGQSPPPLPPRKWARRARLACRERLQRYSRGIRQRIFNQSRDYSWAERHDIHINAGVPGTYSE